MKKIMIFLIMLSFMIMPVNAACSYSEKADAMVKASNVKVDYEIVEDKQEYEEGTSIDEYFKISILNITEELYVVVTNDVTRETLTYNYENVKDGVITFNWENTDTVTNFTFTIYASNKTLCNGEQLKVIRKQTPRYNDFYNRAICEDIKDFYLCQKYTTINNIDESMFIEKVEGFMDGKVDSEGNETQTPNKESNFQNFLKKNLVYIIGGLVVGVGAGTAIVIVSKKRNRGKMVK